MEVAEARVAMATRATVIDVAMIKEAKAFVGRKDGN